MIAKELLRSMLPHAGSMCLLDAVEEWTANRILCTARTHLALAHPLRRAHRLSAVHLIEYAAQAIAVHGTLVATERKNPAEVAGPTKPQPGVLGALRDVRFYVDRLDTLAGALMIEAQRRLAREDGLVYDFFVAESQRRLCEGRAVIALGSPS
jgi:predicted hotdog family 3-hydroxylacyl-ACP dehydratase